MKIEALSIKFWRKSLIAAFWSWETKWWCTLLLRSWIQLLEQLVKPRALKGQQKRLAKTQALALVLELLCTCGDAVKYVCEIWNIVLLLTRFLRVSLNEKLLLLTFSLHFFHLVPCITATIRWFVYFLYLLYLNIYWSLIQLLQDKREKK